MGDLFLFVLFGFLLINFVSFLMAVTSVLNLWRNFNRRKKYGRRGYIYAFTDWFQIMPVVKIGRSRNAKQRLAAHKTSAPFGIIVFCIAPVKDDVYAEGYLHKKYGKWRLSTKSEWFWLTPVLFYELVLIRLLFR